MLAPEIKTRSAQCVLTTPFVLEFVLPSLWDVTRPGASGLVGRPLRIVAQRKFFLSASSEFSLRLGRSDPSLQVAFLEGKYVLVQPREMKRETDGLVKFDCLLPTLQASLTRSRSGSGPCIVTMEPARPWRRWQGH